MSKASESIRKWLEKGAYGERIDDTMQLLQERDNLLAALKVFVNKYNSAPDGVLGIGLVNSDFLAAREAVYTAQGECICSDGPFHYESCPLYDKNKKNPFEELGTLLTK